MTACTQLWRHHQFPVPREAYLDPPAPTHPTRPGPPPSAVTLLLGQHHRFPDPLETTVPISLPLRHVHGTPGAETGPWLLGVMGSRKAHGHHRCLPRMVPTAVLPSLAWHSGDTCRGSQLLPLASLDQQVGNYRAKRQERGQTDNASVWQNVYKKY